MTIGVFDSGLGGLVILRGLVRRLPQYDYVYLGDTKRVPYGDRSAATILRFTKQAVAELFHRGCLVVIVACNTASAAAVRTLQQGWLPTHYPDRRILGVVVPTLEAALRAGPGRLGIIGTNFTVRSRIYPQELRRLQPRRRVIQQAAPELVPLIEANRQKEIDAALKRYAQTMRRQRVTKLILGCTHYPLVAPRLRRHLGPIPVIMRQDRIIPARLADYLRRHPEMDRRLSKRRRRTLLLTALTPRAATLILRWFGSALRPTVIRL